jgi:hypothetical protein
MFVIFGEVGYDFQARVQSYWEDSVDVLSINMTFTWWG